MFFVKLFSRHFFLDVKKKKSSNCLRKNSSSFSIGSKRKNGFSPSSELLHTKFQFWRVRFSLPSHFPSPNTVAEIYRFCPKIQGRFVILHKNTLSQFKSQKISKRMLRQVYVLKIAQAFGFWKNPGCHNLLLRFTDLYLVTYT